MIAFALTALVYKVCWTLARLADRAVPLPLHVGPLRAPLTPADVLDQPAFMETGGMFFPQAINQMFVGLYIEELCLCGLFFLKGANDGGDKAAAFPLGGRASYASLALLTRQSWCSSSS